MLRTTKETTMEITTRRPIDELISIYGEEAVAHELAVEETMAGMGAAQIRKQMENARQRGNESRTSYGQTLIGMSVETISKAITGFLEDANTGRAGRRHLAVKYLRQVDPDVAAYIAMRTVVDGLTGKQQVLQTAAVTIGGHVEDEAHFAAFEEADKKRFTKAQEKAKKGTTYRRKKATMAGHDRRFGVGDEWDAWPEQDKLHVGMKLIEFVVASGLVSVGQKIATRKDTVKILEPTEKLLNWIEKEKARSELLSPAHLPMVVPPLAWTNPFDGGYLSRDAQGRSSLVKTSNRNYLSEMADRADEMPTVYDSVNALQNTRWAINGRVLEAARDLWDREDGGKSPLPSREDVGYVPCPRCGAALELPKLNTRGGVEHECFDDEEDGEQVLRDWKTAAHEAHNANVALRSKRMAAAKTLKAADMYVGYEAIYFPYQLDFRGRIYAMPSFNPQGADLTKGLLHFADGMAIEDGVAAGWLAIHGANVFGFDKASLEDRIQWVEDHAETIFACAANPMGESFWMTADKPWQFLAFCFEWMEFNQQGYGFVSHLPVALDGSCSGIQHFSAMLRDTVGGEAVNLLPQELPADIYQRVCDRVIEKLKKDAGELGSTIPEAALYSQTIADPHLVVSQTTSCYSQAEGEPKEGEALSVSSAMQGRIDEDDDEEVSTTALAIGWLSLKPNRKTTKRQVMTLPYGSTRYSCREYTEVWLKERIEEGYALPWDKSDTFKATQYMSGLIWDAIGETVVAAREAMDWLQSCAKVVAKEELPVYWSTPSGFPVMQLYKNHSSRRVKTKLGESVVKLSLQSEEESIDKRRMSNAISPNFVHSLDASHLMETVALGTGNGISDFAVVHDSFGTHAANTQVLSACLREAFVQLYNETDVLEDFRQQIMRQVTPEMQEKIKPVPPKGDLDVTEVRQADFAFA